MKAFLPLQNSFVPAETHQDDFRTIDSHIATKLAANGGSPSTLTPAERKRFNATMEEYYDVIDTEAAGS